MKKRLSSLSMLLSLGIAAAFCVTQMNEAHAQAPKTQTSQAQAPKKGLRVFVNQKDVTGARNIQLKNVVVRFDAYGNVHVDAPKYNVRIQPGTGSRASTPRTPTPPPQKTAMKTVPGPKLKQPILKTKKVRIPPAKRYFIVGTGKSAPILGCTIELAVDGTVVEKLAGIGSISTIEVTKHLSRGSQNIELRLRRPPQKNIDLSEIDPKILRDAFFEVSFGPGGYDGPNARLTRTIETIRCTDRSGGYKEQSKNITVE